MKKTRKIAALRRLFLAPAEDCSLRLQRWGLRAQFCIYLARKISWGKEFLAEKKFWREKNLAGKKILVEKTF